MNKNGIILVSQSRTFMINSIIASLERNKFPVVNISPTVSELSNAKKSGDVIILYLDNMIDKLPDVEVYIRDLCIDSDKYLFLIGDHMEMQSAKEHFSEKIITDTLERPLDLNLLIRKLDKIENVYAEELRRRNVLVVDDDPTYLKMIQNWLKDEYHVTMATSGMQALTYLVKNKVDLILLDYEMPITSGPKVLEMIRTEPKTMNTPVIFLTGKDDKNSVMKVMGLHPDGYLLKTMPKQDILKAISDFFTLQKNKQMK